MAKLYCGRTGETLDAPTYAKDGMEVLYHRWLNDQFWMMPDDKRPTVAYETVDLRNLPNIPPMFARKCILKKDAVVVEQIGEILCSEWEQMPEISKKFPLTMCDNMAFDRAFIRYMQFSIESKSLYSSSEINVPSENRLMEKAVSPAENTPPEYPWEKDAAESVNIMDIQHMPGKEQVYIATDRGELLYDKASETFGVRNATIEFTHDVLNGLYQQASAMLGMDLKAYAGMVQN